MTVINATTESAWIAFEPEVGPAVYAFYYLPYWFAGGDGARYHATYAMWGENRTASNAAWVAQHTTAMRALEPRVAVSNFTARTHFDRWTPSEVRATAAEVAAVESCTSGAQQTAAAVFVSRREEPLRMFDALPARFARDVARGGGRLIVDAASAHEFYVFQVGLWAFEDLVVDRFHSTGSSAEIRCLSLGGWVDGTAFTQQHAVAAGTLGVLTFGIKVPGDVSVVKVNVTLAYNGSRISPPLCVRLHVDLRPLPQNGTTDSWRLARMGWLDSRRAYNSGVVNGFAAVSVDAASRTIQLQDKLITLGSTGLPASIVANGHELLARPMEFRLLRPNKVSGEQITVFKSGPGLAKWLAVYQFTFAGSLPTVVWSVTVNGSVAYDGYLKFALALKCNATLSSRCRDEQGIELNLAVRQEMAKMMMGLNAVSGKWPARPMTLVNSSTKRGVWMGGDPKKEILFPWSHYSKDVQKSLVWLGTAQAGIRLKLLDINASTSDPRTAPFPWARCRAAAPSHHGLFPCNGSMSVTETQGAVVIKANSPLAPTSLADSREERALQFTFDLLVTPNKRVNISRHFSTRYFQMVGLYPPHTVPAETIVHQILQTNATWLTLQHGNYLNPYINYPLDRTLPGLDQLQSFVDACHAQNARLKLYCTTRILSNRAAELFALKALPYNEVVLAGAGGGGAWLREHLASDYANGWAEIYWNRPSTEFPGQHLVADEAVQDSGAVGGRWNNFYVEMVHQLATVSPKIDGLYLDGIAFDRTTMERVRKVMDAADKKDGMRIDIHMDNMAACKGSSWLSPAQDFMLHFSFADSLWMGEGVDYWEQDAEWWLLEVSGLPWGLTGDMIREGPVGEIGPDGLPGRSSTACPDPNRWLGAVFGMTRRLGSGMSAANSGSGSGWNVSSADAIETLPIWRLWSAFGVQSSRMVGWWDAEPLVKVTALDGDVSDQVKVTVFCHPGSSKALLVVANFRNASAAVALAPTAAWHQVLAPPKSKVLRAPAVLGFQFAQTFGWGQPTTVGSKRGWMLLVE